MKRYKLLKDLPFAKAGEFFSLGTGKRNEISELPIVGENHTATVIWNRDIEDFDEWFEEVKEPKICFTIDFYKSKVKEINTDHYSGWSSLEIANIKRLGLLFYTQEEAEKYAEYLKAKAIIKQDAKGFKPNWRDKDEDRFMGCWDFKRKRALFDYGDAFKTPEIYFKSREDIRESFKKHPEEWKTYLTYEQ